MSEPLILDVDIFTLPGRYWLTIAEKEDVAAVVDQLALFSNLIAPGSLAILEARPVLLSNLRAWENLILPRWYHHAESLSAHDALLRSILQQAEVDEEKVIAMLSCLPGHLDIGQRRVVALLRAAMQQAPVWVVEEEWLDWWEDARGRNPLLNKLHECIAPPPSLLLISLSAAPADYQVVQLVETVDE